MTPGRTAAGIDVGNSTTEIVIADVSVDPPRPVAWDRAPTRGLKGSTRAWAGAARLLQRIEARTGVVASYVVATPQSPVTTTSARLNRPARASGRLAVGARAATTPGSPGLAVGSPVDAAATPWPGVDPVVLLVQRELLWQDVPGRVTAWRAAGRDVAGLLLAEDTGVLVARRLPGQLPVLDVADVVLAAAGKEVALEVAEPGRAVRTLADPVALSAALGLTPTERPDAIEIARRLSGAGSGVVVRLGSAGSAAARAEPDAWVEVAGQRFALSVGVPELRAAGIGATTAYRLPGAAACSCADVWAAELSAALADIGIGDPDGESFVLAALAADDADVVDPLGVLAGQLGRDVLPGPTEASAAWLGAATTPASRAGTVIDLGGGTLDVVDMAESRAARETVAAGAGDLLSVAVATVLGIPLGAAEWVERGPCARVEAPQVLQAENGVRRFLDAPAAADAVGSLVVHGPAGLLPFDRRHSPAEWRLLRRRLKDEVLGANLRRTLRGVKIDGDVLLVGGPAGDDEMVEVAARALPGRAIGRADVAGVLGHRWAVAYGLLLER